MSGWTQLSTRSDNVIGVCTNSTGRILYIAYNTIKLSRSIDNGSTSSILSNSNTGGYVSICCSSLGDIVLVININSIYYSTDYGDNWTLSSSSPSGLNGINKIAVSGNGAYSVAVGVHKLAYSSNFSTFTTVSTTKNWQNVCSNYDGSIFYASTSSTDSSDTGAIYKSPDYGANWTKIFPQIGFPSYNFINLCCDKSGNTLYFSSPGDVNGIYSSSNAGATFSNNSTTVAQYSGLYCSSNGSIVETTVLEDTTLYKSIDNGIVYFPQDLSSIVPINPQWSSIVGSESGNTIYASINEATGSVYQYIKPGTCILENTKIETKSGEVNIQDLKKGDLIKTHTGRYKPLLYIGYNIIDLTLEENKYEIRVVEKKSIDLLPNENLYITRKHSLLFKKIPEEYKNERYYQEITYYDNIINIDGYEKILALHCNECKYVDLKQLINIFGKTVKYYNIVLVNNDEYKEDGIYASGLLVESCSKNWFFKSELKDITL